MRIFVLFILIWTGLSAATPVAEWRFDEGSGSTTADSSGNGHTALVVGAFWESGFAGSGLRVDGKGWIELPTSVALAPQGALSLWCRTTTNASDVAMLFYAGSGAGGNGMGPESEMHLHLQASERPGAFAGDGSGIPRILAPTSGSTVHDGAWHHVALVWNVGGDMRLFLDGTLYGTTPMLGVMPAWNGILRLATSAATDRGFVGSIDEVLLFAEALSDTEVRALSGPGLLAISTPSPLVSEGTANASVTVKRLGGAQGAVAVSYATADGEATAGLDYTAKTGTLSWASGNRADKSISIPIANDAVAEGPERFTVTLSNPTGGAQLGLALATIRINDNEGPGSIEWTAGSVTVAESTATVTLTARRVGGSSGAVSATWQTSDDQALAGADYTAASGSLAWASGETANKTVVVSLINDTTPESPERFLVTLTPVTAFAGLPTQAEVTITDNDQPGTIQLSSGLVEVAEDATSVSFTVQRVGGNVGAVAVSYTTEDASATAGADYTAKSGTVSWAAGNSSNKTVTITLLGDAIEEPEEGFRLRIFNPTNGATLGAITTGVVRIRDDDRPLAVYRLDESTGSTAWDDMDHAMNGTTTAATWVAARTGNGLAFNGTTTKVDLPLNKIRSRRGTIMAWIRASAPPAADAMLVYGSSGTAGNGFGTEQELHLHLGTDGRAGAFIEGGASDVVISGGPIIADNAWHHVAFTWDVAGDAVLYVDAVAVATVAHDALDFAFSSRFRVGQPNAASNIFAGTMDDLRIWTRALPLAEVRAQSGIVQEVILTTPTTIGAGDTTYDGSHLIVQGTTVTIDGSHAFAALTIRNNGTVTHSACTTTSEYRLALHVSGTVTIEAGSKIDVTGKGYVAGRTEGNVSIPSPAGTCGGSHGGYGSTPDQPVNEVYGDFAAPTSLGSGTGSNQGAGLPGGGAIHVVADQLIMNGVINADGASGSKGGAGGSIWIQTQAISGAGIYRAVGGNASYGAGGGGRIAVYWATGSLPAVQCAARGGSSANTAVYSGSGSAGTVYLEQEGQEGTVIIDGLTLPRRDRPTPIWWGERFVGADDPAGQRHHLIVRGAGLAIDPSPVDVEWISAMFDNATVTTARMVAGDIQVLNSSVLESFASTTTSEERLYITADSVLVDAASRIDVRAKGYRPGRTLNNVAMTGPEGSWGGSHAGIGSTGDLPTNPIYGDFLNPTTLGSGTGVYGGTGRSGGGAVHLIAQSLTMHGTITADGEDGPEGGAGGSILIQAQAISGAGIYRAVGGSATYGAGGGGRIAMYWATGTLPAAQCAARGGGSSYFLAGAGSAGTVYLQQAGQDGTVIIDGLTVPRRDRPTPIYFGERFNPADDPTSMELTILVKGAGAVFDPSPTEVLWTSMVLDNATATASFVDAGTMQLVGNSILQSGMTSTTQEERLVVHADNVHIAAGSKIDVTARGYGPGRTVGNVEMTGPEGSWGGSHGGYGSTGDLATNEVYGNVATPTSLGSGTGSYSNAPQSGGGAIHLVVGTLTIDGDVAADGGTGGQGGAGGSIWIQADSLGGSGVIRAVGGNGTFGAGGGGRIALHWVSGGIPTEHCAARGGSSGYFAAGPGNPGTIFFQQQGQMYGILHVSNGTYAVNRSTPLFYGEVFADSDLRCPWDVTLDIVAPATVTVPYPHQFDGDSDGLTSWEEAALGSLPRDADTNDDGIIDGHAVTMGVDLFNTDQDGDGIPNAVELQQGTDPFRADTDHDGVDDMNDAFPLDPGRWLPLAPTPGDVTAPLITVTAPAFLTPLN